MALGCTSFYLLLSKIHFFFHLIMSQWIPPVISSEYSRKFTRMFLMKILMEYLLWFIRIFFPMILLWFLHTLLPDFISARIPLVLPAAIAPEVLDKIPPGITPVISLGISLWFLKELQIFFPMIYSDMSLKISSGIILIIPARIPPKMPHYFNYFCSRSIC